MFPKCLPAILATVLSLAMAPAAAADQLIKNGGFESFWADQGGTPRPTAWLASGGVQSNPAQAYGGSGTQVDPYAPQRMAVLATGGTMSQDLLQVTDFTGYSFVTLSFWYRYQARDYDEVDNGRDVLELYAKENPLPNIPPLDPTWDLVWAIPIDANPADGWVISPWTSVTRSGPTSGTGPIAFRFYLRNGASGGVPDGGELSQMSPTGSTGQATIVFLDNVSIEGRPATAVPEPSAMLLLGLGLLGLARVKRP